MQVLSRVRPDMHADTLLELSLSEVKSGRLDGPFSVDDMDLDKVAIAPRFGVAQGRFYTLITSSHA